MKIIMKLKRYIIFILLCIGICLILNPVERIYVFIFAERYATECFEGLKIQILNNGNVIYKDSLLMNRLLYLKKYYAIVKMMIKLFFVNITICLMEHSTINI